MAHELGHYVLGHPNYDDAHQRERDANAKGVEIMVRLGTGGDEALRRMHAVLVGTYRFQARTGKWPSLGHNPCAGIRRRIRAAASAAHRAASEGLRLTAARRYVGSLKPCRASSFQVPPCFCHT